MNIRPFGQSPRSKKWEIDYIIVTMIVRFLKMVSKWICGGILGIQQANFQGESQEAILRLIGEATFMLIAAQN